MLGIRSSLRHRQGAALICLLLLAGPSLADELHFLIVFGSDHPSHRARHAHTFATFVKATGKGLSLDDYDLEHFTISWFPQTERVRVCCLLPEPGINVSLSESLERAAGSGAISMWGPYQIEPELYRRAQEQYLRMETGQLRYKAVVTGFHSHQVSNCIHAVADLADPPGRRLGKPCWGESASYYTMLLLLPFVIDRQQTHDWLIDRLGIREHALQARGLEENPQDRPLRRSLQDVWHRKALRNLR